MPTTPLPWFSFFATLSFCWGACIGSFLNVCIHRIPRELSTVTPRSYCPRCKKQIPWYLNIPLFSYLMLGAKCKYCGAKISFRYFVVELLTAVLFLLVWRKFGFGTDPRMLGLTPITDWKLVPVYWLVVSGLVMGTFVDFEHLIIPDRVTLGGIAAGLVLSPLIPSLHNETHALHSLGWSALGTLLGAFILWALAVVGKMIFRKDAMGMGDVKLLGAIGAFMGWRAVLFNVLASSLAGSLVGISLVLVGRKKMQSRIPYGPYIALAAVIWILWGPNLWNAYINLIAPPPAYYVP